MKINIKYLASLIFIFVPLISCAGNSLELVGKVHVSETNGFKCWYIVDETTGLLYELVSPDQFLLQEGRKVKLEAKQSSSETICKVGDRIEVVSYKLVN